MFFQILEEQHTLFFHLQQQRLIELIRLGKIEEALAFAQEYLAPQGEENPEFLQELGRCGAPFFFVSVQNRELPLVIVTPWCVWSVRPCSPWVRSPYLKLCYVM